ncbi:exonuclease II Exo2 [Coemansia helicoidea]|uniref:Exonuclease II Exo2 n=1 Tax=Coemansia helicoidea TaxID=1286919 RepID=A0ACC1L955_9FUNG|nr:exonuclease II Exo2 [Coemansia helicoidea]
MGVPGLWRWLRQQFPGAFRTATRFEARPHTLLLDLNGIVHESMRQAGAGPATVLEAIGAAVELVRPRHTVFLAIDGVAPRTKAPEQRSRRAQYAPADGRAFSPLLVTAGTEWMGRLEEQVRAYIGQQQGAQWGGVRVVLSGRADPGEGEHKIAAYLRRARDACLVWSGDGDAVLLALAARAPTTVVRGHPTGPSIAAVDVDLLRRLLCAAYAAQPATPRVADDLVFVALLAGGDALPPLLAASDCAAAELWAVHRSTARPGEHLHDRGVINVPALRRLLAGVVRDHEDRAFRRYVGATALGSELAALRARRLAWIADPEAAPASVPARRQKQGRKGHSKAQRRAPRRRPGAPPLVWTGSATSLSAVADIALLPDARPLAAPPESARDDFSGDDVTLLTLEGRPLLSLAMAPVAAWLLDTAEAGAAAAVAGAPALGPRKVAALQALADGLGLRLDCYAAGDDGYAEQHARWRQLREDAAPEAALLAADAQLVLVAHATGPRAGAVSRVVSVVGDAEWDVLRADAELERRAAAEQAKWRAAFYWHSRLPADVFRGRLCEWYAGLLGWTAAYYFGGRVPSWTLAADYTTAPLASDLLALARDIEQWPVPCSPDPPPGLAEHLLSVLPPAAWPSMLPAAHAALARGLRDAHYSAAAHAHVAQALAAATGDEAPLVYIWHGM